MKFVCPDKETIESEECFNGCRMDRRCVTKATLRAIGQQREWKGVPSVTQLLNGTCQSWLQINNENPLEIYDSIYRIHGTAVHYYLESFTPDTSKAEIKLELNGITGICDLVEYENDEVILYDYKNYGSYKVMKCLGLECTGYEESDEVYTLYFQ